MTDCVFCKIATGEIPSKKVLENDDVFVFHDTNPATQYHVLIIPKTHIKNLEDISAKHKQILFAMTKAAQKIIKQQKPKKYRLIFNGGEFLEVNHLHWHLQIGNFTKHAKKRLAEL